MSDHKQREKAPSLTRIIEASQQERIAMSLILGGLVRAKGPQQSRHRRCLEQFKIHEAAEAMADAEVAAEEEAAAKGPNVAPKGVRISQFSPEMAEYEVTADVIEYFTKACAETEIPGGWLAYSGNVVERMEDKSYKAPSEKAEETNGAPAEEAAAVQ